MLNFVKGVKAWKKAKFEKRGESESTSDSKACWLALDAKRSTKNANEIKISPHTKIKLIYVPTLLLPYFLCL